MLKYGYLLEQKEKIIYVVTIYTNNGYLLFRTSIFKVKALEEFIALVIIVKIIIITNILKVAIQFTHLLHFHKKQCLYG